MPLDAGEIMKFLSKENYHGEIEGAFLNDEYIDIAVAFWGIDALSLFNPKSEKKIRIICNLESSACNPFVIKKLQKYGNIHLKTNKHLHAKILLQESSAIIGSANISANGLSFEGSELYGWLEAGILTEDENIIKNASAWFELLWESSASITDEILDSVVKLWKKRRNQRSTLRKVESLFDAAKQNVDNFKDREIYFVMYRDGKLSEEASTTLEYAKNMQTNLSERIECYEGWSELPDNAYLIDIYYGPRGRVNVGGIYWTPDEPIIEKFKYEDGTDGEIKLCFKKNSIHGFKITKENKEVIKKHVVELWEHQSDDGVSIIPFIDGMKILRKSI